MSFKYGNLYKYQYELIQQGKCYVCSGKGKKSYDDDERGEVVTVPCHHCKGSTIPTEEDFVRRALYDQRICVICGLPMVGDHDTATKYEPSSKNDCLNHAVQEIGKLVKRIEALEGYLPSS